MKKMGFIGVGELALYTIRGIRRGGYRGPILLSPRNHEKAALLAEQYDCQVQADNQSVATNSDYLVIATRPADCLATLSALSLRPGQVLVSVVAGIAIDALRAVVADDVEILRAMPVSSAEVGSSPTLIFPKNDFVAELFDYCGQAITVEDEQYFNQGSILACVYSWFFVLFEELTRATQGQELPRELAAELVMGMARGAADLALADPASTPGEIAEHIATDGTYSRLGLDLLQQQQAFDPWREACELLRQRLAGDG